MTTEMLTRAAPIAGTADEKSRTVEVCFASGVSVKRSSWEEGQYLETLVISEQAINAERLNKGMSFLDSHRGVGMENRLGSVVPNSFRVRDGKAFVTIQFSRKEKAEEVFRDILDGLVQPVSVGYRIDKFEKTEGTKGEIPTIRATAWTPLEISAVPVPADANAHTRAEEDMNDTNTIDRQDTSRKLRKAERVELIRGLAAGARLDDEEIDELVSETRNTTDIEIRAALFDKLVQRQEQTPTFPHVETRGVQDRPSEIRSAMASALMHRVDSSIKPEGDARQFVGLSIPELARRGLELNGVSTLGMSAGQVIERSLHTTSDFGLVISNVGQTTLQAAYSAVPSPLKTVGRQSTIRDFKLKHAVRLSGFSDLEKVNEHGEFTRGTFEEGGESYKLDTFGKVFSMTRQMLINDELGAFAKLTRDLGAAARRREADILANLVKSNPKMSDGKALFHVDHKNLGTPAALSEESLSAARLAMSRQTGLAGELIDVTPKYLVVGLDLQTKAEKLLTAIQATNTDDVNVFANRLQLVVDRRLTNPTAWYLVASPGEVDGLEYAYLEGQEQPFFDTRVGFDVDGVETKVRIDFGAGFLDHRGWYMNPGQ